MEHFEIQKKFSTPRYHSLAILIGISIAFAALGYLYHYLSITQLQNAGENHNIAITRAITNMIWGKYEAFLPIASTMATKQLVAHKITIKTHASILKSIKGLPVLKVKIFNQSGKTVFSTENTQIGEIKPKSYPGRRVTVTGKIYSRMSFREKFNAIQGNLSDRYVLSSYMPIYNLQGSTIIAVLEVYYDTTNSVAAIKTNRVYTFLAIVFSLSLLYVILLAITNRADKIIQRQANELEIKLKQIQDQNILLEKRVLERDEVVNELAVHKNQLEEKIHERTNALNKAKNEAENASKSKGQFLANMSHELRTPLNAILGYTEFMLEDYNENESASKDLKKIHVAGTQLLRIISDILDLSKIEARKMDIYNERADINEILKEVIDSVKCLADKKNNIVKFDCDDDIGSTLIDTLKLRQILYNLLSNAIKFTKDGQITVHANCSQNQSGGWLKIQVSDTGIGMDSVQAGQVFKSFSQADESTTREYGGTGLGLAINKGLCKLMGGTISVESEVDRGATFTVRLPIILESDKPHSNTEILNVGPKVDPALVRLGPGRSGEEKRRTKIGTILAVDDDAETRDLMERFFTRSGFHTYTAISTDEGLQLAKEIIPDVILTDIIMTERDGISFIKSVKSDPSLAKIPIIVVSISAEREICLDLGVIAYFNKPIHWQQLLQTIIKEFRKINEISLQNTA